MKQESLIRWKELLVIQMNHWVYFAIVMTCLGLIGDQKPGMPLWILLSILPYVLFLIRRYTDSFLIFVLSHAGIGGAVILLPIEHLAVKAAICVTVIWYVVHSCVLRLRTAERLGQPIHPAAGVLFSAAALLIQRSQGHKDWDIYYVVSVIAFIAFYFIYYYVKSYLNFLMVNSSSAGHIPEQEMFRSGVILAGIYTLTGAVVLFVTGSFAWLSQLLDPVRRLIAWLLNKFSYNSVPGDPVPDIVPETSVPNQLFPFEETEPSLIWVLLEKILFGAVMAALAAGAVLGIVRLILFLWGSFHKKAVIQEDQLDGIRDIREKCGIEHKQGDKKPMFGFLNPSRRIRKIYRKRVLAEKDRLLEETDTGVLDMLTARECGRRLDLEEMAGIYEKARYSGEECSMDDVKQMKTAANR